MINKDILSHSKNILNLKSLFSARYCISIRIKDTEDLDSNEFLSKSLWHYTIRNLFSYSLHSKILTKGIYFLK